MVAFTTSQAAKLPWFTALLTVTCISLAIVFHLRWTRPISQWPINLPLRRYQFIEHPDLRGFDDEAIKNRWANMVWHNWWDTEWQDDTGRRFPRGIDVFHKMHCLVAIREEFTELATDETRATREAALRARDVEAKGKKIDLILNRNHLEHCFDFLRQDILCAADMTLEPLADGYMETDGLGVEHECRDWRLLLQHVGLSDVDEI
ncbi:hypothetical protein TARUN_2698 [Trichoderma arundinaceum]|uniref:Uncharacterized protein n=1 Tax=Trichoderma arundinaceum TaxID=490622 RepID=A0A395NVI8_TRIAR|nr:hypothetical protein TARUN_2698 [Trichoderma arundinaceum]